MKQPLRILLVVGIVFVLLWAGLALRNRLQRPPSVAVSEVVREDVTRVLAVTGRVRPEFTNTLRPTVSGRLVELLFAEGNAVEAGQLMARIDAGAEQARLRRSQAAVAEQETAVAQLKRDAARSEQLWREGLIPESQYESDAALAERAAERLEELRQGVVEARASLRDFELRAPVDGWVLRRPVDPGQTVSANTVIYEVSTRSVPMVEISVDELYLTEIKVGLDASIAPLRAADEVWSGAVSYVGRQVDQSTGAGIVRLVFDEEFTERARDLPVGLSLDVNIEIARHDDVLIVPREAVSGLGAQPFVLLASAGNAGRDTPEEPTLRARRVPVDVIDWPAPMLVVRDGLSEGDLVIENPRSVVEGAAVRIDSAVGDGQRGLASADE